MAVDLSEPGEEPFSSWRVEVDRSKLSPGEHDISLVISLGDRESIITWRNTISVDALNRCPMFESLVLRYQTFSMDLKKELEYPVHVSPNSPYFNVTVNVYEPDHDLEILEDSEGRLLDEMEARVTSLDGNGEVYLQVIKIVGNSKDGMYRALFLVDTSRTMSSYDPWEAGRYALDIWATDTGGKVAGPFRRNLLLYVDQPPLLKVRAGKDDPVDPTPDPVYPGTSFSFEVASDRELKVYFQLRGCRDIDDENYFPDPQLDRSWQNLTYKAYIQPLGGEKVLVFGPWKGAEGFFHMFDLSNYTEGDTPVFELILEVSDMDGLSTEGSYAVNIEIGPPKDGPPPLVPLWVVIGLGVFWAAAIAASFGLVLPAYNRRKRDKIRRIMKDPRLKEFAKDAMKGEKPSDFTLSRRELKTGLDNRLKRGTIDLQTYDSIVDDLYLGQENEKINSD
jgi:hypothetical protein